jgi:hypothetical protein
MEPYYPLNCSEGTVIRHSTAQDRSSPNIVTCLFNLNQGPLRQQSDKIHVSTLTA